MASAKLVALRARASQISHLCFPVPGIIESLRLVAPPIQFFGETDRTIQLGDSVTQFDFVNFYAGLNKTSGDPTTLIYNSSGILNDPKVQTSLLMTLRAEPTAAILDKAIKVRQNAYYAKYANEQEIISVITQLYTATSTPSTTISKPDALASLFGVAQAQMNDLLAAYGEAPLPTLPQLPSVVKGTSSVLQTTGGFPDTTQKIANTDYAYRTPTYEAQAQGLRAQISLIDQQSSQYMAGQNLRNLQHVFDNEKQSIDLDVKRLQIAYLNTILMSPINGIITGIYKNAGDWVQAGEPVIRVEDNRKVILVGTLRYQGLISPGSQMTITTSLFDSSVSPPITAYIIAVRGRPNEDDLWDVHAVFDNSAAPALPFNYNFVYDNTSVSIS